MVFVATNQFWDSLPNTILNQAGKKIVSQDPELMDDTIEKLCSVMPPRGTYQFTFGEDEHGPNISSSLLSMCIDENPSATLAELTARYALTKKICFTDCAIALAKLNSDRSIFHYVRTGKDGLLERRRWVPSFAAYRVPPTKNKLPASLKAMFYKSESVVGSEKSAPPPAKKKKPSQSCCLNIDQLEFAPIIDIPPEEDGDDNLLRIPPKKRAGSTEYLSKLKYSTGELSEIKQAAEENAGIEPEPQPLSVHIIVPDPPIVATPQVSGQPEDTPKRKRGRPPKPKPEGYMAEKKSRTRKSANAAGITQDGTESSEMPVIPEKKKRGRKRKERPPEFGELYTKWKNKEMSARAISFIIGISNTAAITWLKEEDEKRRKTSVHDHDGESSPLSGKE